MSITWTTIALLIAAVATVQWLVFAAISAFSRARFPKNGTMRKSEKLLLVSSAVLAAGWLAQLDYAAMWKPDVPVAVASSTSVSRGSCATLSAGMSGAEVKSRMGDPDEERPNEETRGPGAKTLIYRDSRCAVHLFDDRVDFIE